jgi:glutaredoxin/glutathione-dependent peroxiredoxin
MINIGDKLPEGTLYESVGYDEKTHCPTGPVPVSVADLTRGKKVVFFGLPGAFTPTCSGKHVPGYLEHADALKQRGVAEIVCLSVNDGFVMAAWGIDQKVNGKIRMLGDGSAAFTKALGLELDLTANGMGVPKTRSATKGATCVPRCPLTGRRPYRVAPSTRSIFRRSSMRSTRSST